MVDALLRKGDFRASLALLASWLGQGEQVPLEDGAYSFHALALRWMLAVIQPAEGGAAAQPPAAERRALVVKFFDYLEANAEEYWEVPALDAGEAEAWLASVDPVDENRRLQLHDLLVWQAQRTWLDYWASADPANPYYRTAGLVYTGDASDLVGGAHVDPVAREVADRTVDQCQFAGGAHVHAVPGYAETIDGQAFQRHHARADGDAMMPSASPASDCCTPATPTPSLTMLIDLVMATAP